MEQSQYLEENIDNLQRLISATGIDEKQVEKLKGLLVLSRLRMYDPGERIIEEGKNDAWLYFLLKGRIKVEKCDVEICDIEKPGEMFGEMSIVDGKERSATVRAVEKTLCLAVDTRAASRLTDSDRRADILIYLFRTVAEFTALRLRLANEELIQLKREKEAATAE